MILEIKKLRLYLNIDKLLINQLLSYGKQYYPNEFGGFLIGYYSEDMKTVFITNTILPIKFKASEYTFERDTNNLKEQFEKYYKETPKKYYLGEWHTHPNNLAIPSLTDVNTMKSIANNPSVSIHYPILLIISYNKFDFDFGFYLHKKNKLYKYE